MIINDFFFEILQVLKLYKKRDKLDEKDKEYLDYVEMQRVQINLRRSIFFSIFLLLMNISGIIVPFIRNKTDKFLVFGIAIACILLLVYIINGERLYKVPKENFKDYHYRKKVEPVYTFYWSIYYALLIFCSATFSGLLQNLILWMIMIFIGLTLPVFNRIEFCLVLPVAMTSVIIYIYSLDLGADIIITIVPIFILLIIATQINNLERLLSFYNNALSMSESSKSKQKLKGVLEEVFDLGFEFDLKENTCEVLCTNGKYDFGMKEKIDIREFFNKMSSLSYSDDSHICEKSFNTDYINDEFLLGRSQIYFEMRIRTVDGDYNWVSVLITRETAAENGRFLICLIQDIEDRKINEDKLRIMAEKDPLTQLYNKMTTKSLIEECLEKNSSMQHALIIIDIDNFKTINDTKGHIIGDQILLAFATELNNNFRETDILGRAGGDEFVVLIKNVQSIAMVCDKLQRLIASFKKYGIENGFPGRLSTSIGVAIFNKDGKTYEELFKKADAALYEAKRNGKDQYKFSISKT